MAKGILALMAGKPKAGGSLPGESSGAGASPLNEKAEILKRMWGEMKSGDFESAAMSFEEAYDMCAGGGEEPELDLGDETEGEDEMEL